MSTHIYFAVLIDRVHIKSLLNEKSVILLVEKTARTRIIT